MGATVPESRGSNRNISRGILELARLHKPELTLLAWYPSVWTFCLVLHKLGNPIEASDFFPVILKNYLIVALTHSTCCTMNDILDRNIDGLIPRTASRPLPSGMVTLRIAILAFIVWAATTMITTAYLQGTYSLVLWTPAWILSLLYPLGKRFISFPQLILGSACACVLIPAWVNGGGGESESEELTPMVFFIIFWIIYIDMFYATMDSEHDTAAGVGTLAVTLKPRIHLYLSLLAFLQLLCLSVLGYRTQRSALFWILGVGVWAVNNIWHISGLRIVDGDWAAGSGHTIFTRNIGLGLWLSVVEVLEFWRGGEMVF
ncbi:uncharacterized protein PAC_08437 [Phialocephala subalpina]|uniref:Uncharacterized protein n=1 Tax=Phialocephala subalpina TaxID=576137 RepID=A0A1L7X0K3_9HELO|nr:uncharacterized protein PAC_08437 [Phialocephala subalpina]